jgi:hypothetical protein
MKIKLSKKFISKMTDINIIELEKKMADMDKILNANLFNNPIREINETLRKDLLEFREIFNKDLLTMENLLVKNILFLFFLFLLILLFYFYFLII